MPSIIAVDIGSMAEISPAEISLSPAVASHLKVCLEMARPWRYKAFNIMASSLRRAACWWIDDNSGTGGKAPPFGDQTTAPSGMGSVLRKDAKQ